MVSYQTVKVSKKTEDSFTIRKSREFCLLENQLQRCGINTKTWSLVVVRLLISSVIEEYSNAGDIATQRHRVAQISNLQTSNTTSSKWLSTGRHGIPPIGIPNDQNPKMLRLWEPMNIESSYSLPPRAEFHIKECIHQIKGSVPFAQSYINFLQ